MQVQNAPEREEYQQVLTALKGPLDNLPPIVVAIDGRSGVGKTTLGRFLSWRFNVTLLETDLYLERNIGALNYRQDEIQRIIDQRLQGDRPIIVEGMLALDVLYSVDRIPSFYVRVEAHDVEGHTPLDEIWEAYQSRSGARQMPDLRVDLPVLG